jgi:hypothetical protein
MHYRGKKGIFIGKKDKGSRNLLDCPDVFADISNVNLFHGEEILRKEELKPMPTVILTKPDGVTLKENILDNRMLYLKSGMEIAIVCGENQSDFRHIADYLACRGDKEKLREFRKDETRIIKHPEEFLDMMDAFAGTTTYKAVKKTLEEKKGGEQKMCVLYDMVFGEGKEAGLSEGRKLGFNEGERSGKETEAIANAKMLFRNGVSMEIVASSITTISKEKLEEIYREEHKHY